MIILLSWIINNCESGNAIVKHSKIKKEARHCNTFAKESGFKHSDVARRIGGTEESFVMPIESLIKSNDLNLSQWLISEDWYKSAKKITTVRNWKRFGTKRDCVSHYVKTTICIVTKQELSC